MIPLSNIKRIAEFEWEIPQSYRKDMRVPVRIIASESILKKAQCDLSFEQAVNATTLPGTVGFVAVMPDVHQGYGFPIGGISATKYPDGVISPGAIGYDINCGIRLLISNIMLSDAQDDLENLASSLVDFCPSGMGKEGSWMLTIRELEQVCYQGMNWAIKKGYANKSDIERTEDQGCLENADPSAVSRLAKDRGKGQLGTLGSGNHFIEVGVIDEIIDQKAAKILGINLNCLTLMIHSGSRGLGHQVCTDYVHLFQDVVRQRHISIPDRELVCAPLDSPEGQAYLGAMRAAANFAYVNRQLLAFSARRAFEKVFSGKFRNWFLNQVYDVTHNIGKIESHIIDGKKTKVCVHRKGATRSLSSQSAGLPMEFYNIGQPVFVPGSMGTSSWILLGQPPAQLLSFSSSAHGAGRNLSRIQAKKLTNGEVLKNELRKAGILIRAGSIKGIAEEAPQAYKDVDEVVDVVCGAGMVTKVARIHPVIVVKG